MPWRPTGFITVREATLRLADALHPDARVREYTAKPWPDAPGGISGPVRVALMGADRDPYRMPRVSTEDLEWQALEEARQHIEQAAGDAKLVVFIRSPPWEDAFPLKAATWRKSALDESGQRRLTSDIFSHDQREVELLGYLVCEADFEAWRLEHDISGVEQATSRVQATFDEHLAWATVWAKEHPRTKYDVAIEDLCKERRIPVRMAREVWRAVPEGLRRTRGDRG